MLTTISETIRHGRVRNPVSILTLGLILHLTPVANGADLRLEATAKHSLRPGTPITIAVPEALATSRSFRLTRGEDERPIPIQRSLERSGDRLVWLLQEPLTQGELRRYKLAGLKQPAPNGEAPATCIDNGSQLILSARGRPVLKYHHAVNEAPPGIEDFYRRSGYIHPLYNPDGLEITGDFPGDHPHQHGIFFAWVKTTFGKAQPDFWNQAKASGAIAHAEIVETVSGPVFAQFTVRLRHQEQADRTHPVSVLSEIWTVRAYNLTEPFLVDFESRQECIADTPLVVKEYHYGGLAIRGNGQWFDEETAARLQRLVRSKAAPGELAAAPLLRDYLTSEGKTWIDGNATRARWVAMHGKIDGQSAGLTVLSHPDNFRAPQTVRLHPTKPYFCFAPMALGDFEISPGREYVSRYRFHVPSGQTSAEGSDRAWLEFAEPVNVRVVEVEDR